MTKKIVLFLLVCFMLSASHPVSAASVIRVMTYNIRYDNPADSLDNWKYRKEFITSLIRFHEVDLLGIQEGLIQQVHYLDSTLKEFGRCGVGREDGQEAGEFSAIYYNKNLYSLISDSTFWLSPTPNKPSKGWDAALERIVTWGALERQADGKDLLLF